jgi:predicted transcriptional regulator
MSAIEKLPKMIKLLEQKASLSPNKISKELQSDRRTTEKLLETSEKIGIVDCRSIEVSGREFRSCSLNPEYKKLKKYVK